MEVELEVSNNQITWIAPSSGTYFVSVGHFEDVAVGTYSLSLHETTVGEVPGPEVIVEVPGPERIVEVERADFIGGSGNFSFVLAAGLIVVGILVGLAVTRIRPLLSSSRSTKKDLAE